MKKELFLVCLLLFIAPAFAAPPTVDFNWYVGSTLNPNPRVFQTVIFDPRITSGSTLKNLNWMFSTDGNINYYGGSQLFFDNFSDGSAADWNVFSGSWSAASNYLSTTSINAEIGKNGDFNIADANFQWNFTFTCFGAAPHECRTNLTNDNANTPSSKYRVQNVGTSIVLIKVGTGTLIDAGAGTFTFGTTYDVNVTRQSDGNWALFTQGVNRGTAIDTSTETSNFFFFLESTDTADEGRWDNFSLSNTSTINGDKNETHTFMSVGTKTVCLTAGNTDGNSTTCHDLNISGNLLLQVFDENTNTVLPSAQATFDGNSFFADSNGVISIDTPVSPSNFRVSVFDSNHHTRIFTFYLDSNSSITQQLYLIDTNTGRDIDFLVRDVNAVKYPGYFFRIEKNGKLVWKTATDNEAIIRAIPLSNLVKDYNWFIDLNTDTSTNLISYRNTTVQVNVPLNELNQSAITPYSVLVTDLTSIDQNALVAPFLFNVYPNTRSPYALTVDENAALYFPRYYHFRTKGGQTSYTIQPYLLRAVDGGVSGTFTVSDSLTQRSVPSYVFEFRTDVGMQASVLVESPQTDSAGKFLFTTITGKRYDLTVLNENGDIVEMGQFISSTSTEYFYDLFTGLITITDPNFGTVDINILVPEPGIGFFYKNDLNNYGLRFKIIKGGETLPTVSSVRVTLTQVGTVIADFNFSPAFPSTNYPSGTTFDVNFTNANQAYLVNVTISMSTSIGVITKGYKIPLRSILRPNTNIPNFGALVEEIGSVGGTFLWLIIAVSIGIGIRFTPLSGVGNSGLVFIIMAWTLMAGFINLIPITIAALACIGALAFWFLRNQPLGAR